MDFSEGVASFLIIQFWTQRGNEMQELSTVARIVVFRDSRAEVFHLVFAWHIAIPCKCRSRCHESNNTHNDDSVDFHVFLTV